MLILASILPRGFIILMLFATLINIFQAQSRLDMFLDMPKKIELPSDYLASQTGAQPFHAFKIKFELLTVTDIIGFSTDSIDRMFYITSFFYSLLIKVQDISQSQTKFPNVTDGKGYCFNQKIPQDYVNYGFSTKKYDLIVFANYQNQINPDEGDGAGAGACVVERRPLYGLYNFFNSRLNVFQDNANYHNTLVRMIHSILHILCFNTNFIVQRSHTQITEMLNHKNDATFFFANAKSNQRLLVKEVIDVDAGQEHPKIITKKVQKAVRQIFQCSQADYVGAVLQKVKDDSQNQYVRFHWHPQIYQDQFMVYIQLQYGQRTNYKYTELLKQNQQLRMSKLSWAMLQDSGFYEQVYTSLTDNFKPRTFQTLFYSWFKVNNDIIPKCQMHKSLYAQSNFKQQKHCNVYGTSKRNTYYDLATFTTIQNKQKFQENKCTKMSPNFRCIQILYVPNSNRWYQSYQQCTYSECINNDTIRILFGGEWQNVCTRKQAGQDKSLGFRANFTIHCPSDFDAFCNEKSCENWCKKQGICINGKCYYPQTRFQSLLKKQSLQYNFYPQFLDNGKILAGKVCQRNCLDCYMINDFTQQVCKVRKIHADDYNLGYTLCSLGVKTCLGHSKAVTPCFQSYFFQSNQCYRCHSSCTYCEQTYGSRQMINFCKNCQEGNFPFYELCESCQVENCMYCKKQGKCLKCKINYYLATFQNSTQSCLRCLSNCGICDSNNMTRCLSCAEGHFLYENQCQRCIAFCRKCSTNQTCIQCYIGFIYRQNACVRPCELPCRQCALGQPNKCLSCAAFHIYNDTDNSCKNFTNTSIQNCPLGYYKAKTEGVIESKCLIIPINNCIVATQRYETVNYSKLIVFCSICAKGFFVSQLNKCLPCPVGCSYCFQSDVCGVCDDGFSNPKNIDGSRNTVKCQKCAQNCLKCPASPYQCQLCSQNYGLIGTQCHSVNQIKVQFIFDAQYSFFVKNNKLETIKRMILLLIDQKSKIQVTKIQQGSIKVFGIVSRPFQGQVEKDCMLSYNLTSKFTMAVAQSEFPLIGASFENNIPECDNFSPQQAVQIVYFISGGATILVIILIIIIIWLVRKLALKEKIVLKYEELLSRPQYMGDTVQKIGF